MNRIPSLLFALFSVVVLLSSCSGDDAPRLLISNLTVAEQDHGIMNVEDTLGVWATVIADEGIQSIRINIDSEEVDGAEWHYSGLFIGNYSTKQVAAFAELVPFPVEASPGSYILTLTLINDLGDEVSDEITFTLLPSDG